MAELTTKELSLPQAADLLDPPAPRDESKWHVSTLVGEAAKAAKSKWAYHDDGVFEENGIMALGRMWEFCVRPMVEENAAERGVSFYEGKRLAPIALDDTIGTVDGLLLPKGFLGPNAPILAVVEIKSRHARPADPRDHWRWMTQSKAYCYMTRCSSLWMPVVYILHSPPDAKLLLHQIVFEDWELEENWAMLMNVKRSLEVRENA